MKNINKLCLLCNDPVDTTGKYCQKCYNYLRIHPEGVYPIPPVGEVHYANNGDPICHICGMAYRKLGNHVAFRHHMTQQEYRDRFKLYHNTKLSNNGYKELMRLYNKENYDIVVKQNLIKGGVNTRVSEDNNLPGRKYGRRIKELYVKEESND